MQQGVRGPTPLLLSPRTPLNQRDDWTAGQHRRTLSMLNAQACWLSQYFLKFPSMNSSLATQKSERKRWRT